MAALRSVRVAPFVFFFQYRAERYVFSRLFIFFAAIRANSYLAEFVSDQSHTRFKMYEEHTGKSLPQSVAEVACELVVESSVRK